MIHANLAAVATLVLAALVPTTVEKPDASQVGSTVSSQAMPPATTMQAFRGPDEHNRTLVGSARGRA